MHYIFPDDSFRVQVHRSGQTATMTVASLLALCLSTPALAEIKSGQNAIEIYPPHTAPADMTWVEQALHNRTTESAIWAMTLMNYKATFVLALPKKNSPLHLGSGLKKPDGNASRFDIISQSSILFVKNPCHYPICP